MTLEKPGRLPLVGRYHHIAEFLPAGPQRLAAAPDSVSELAGRLGQPAPAPSAGRPASGVTARAVEAPRMAEVLTSSAPGKAGACGQRHTQ